MFREKHFIFVLLVIFMINNDSFPCEVRYRDPFGQNKHIAILILARGGSKGIKLKNIATVGNHSLLERALDSTRENAFLDSVWVSTDNLDIAKVAEKNKVNIHWRSEESATDTASSIYATQEFLQHHPEIDVVGLVQCTSPFITNIYLQKAANLVVNGKECVFSVSRSYKLRWQEIGEKVVALNFNPLRRPRRQDWNGELQENGMFYFASRKLIQRGIFQSDR